MDRFTALLSGISIIGLLLIVTMISISVFENKIQEKIWKLPIRDPQQVYYTAIVDQLDKTHNFLFGLLAVIFLVPITFLVVAKMYLY